MELIVVPVVLVIVVIGIVMLSRRPSDQSPPPSKPTTQADSTPTMVEENPAPPVFNVVQMAPPGAGKTVFLACMFHHLAFRSERRAYYLEASPDTVVELGQLYRTLSDTAEPWPSPTHTADVAEYLFKCVAMDASNRKHHVLSLKYLDYDGSLLQWQQENPGPFQRLSQSIQSAHALLAMIDGRRVLQLLRNETAGRNYFEYDTRAMFKLMQDAECPIHLVISKWDLVRDFGEPGNADERFRLDRVIDALLSFDHIRALALLRNPTQIVRIIPVSAVGPTFARLDPSGIVVKRPEGKVQPVRIEVPLSAVVPDLFKQVESRLDGSARREIDETVRSHPDLQPGYLSSSVAAFSKGPVASILGRAMRPIVGDDFGNEVAKMFLQWSARPPRAKEAKAAVKREPVDRQLELKLEARAKVLEDFTQSILRLETTLPNSSISR
jgi:hypothetical protein